MKSKWMNLRNGKFDEEEFLRRDDDDDDTNYFLN